VANLDDTIRKASAIAVVVETRPRVSPSFHKPPLRTLNAGQKVDEEEPLSMPRARSLKVQTLFPSDFVC
jgi:hypothetical protein